MRKHYNIITAENPDRMLLKDRDLCRRSGDTGRRLTIKHLSFDAFRDKLVDFLKMAGRLKFC